MAKPARAAAPHTVAPAKTAKIFSFPNSKGVVTPTYRALIERHRAARAAHVQGYWGLIDHPAAADVMLQIDELCRFSQAKGLNTPVLHSRKMLHLMIRLYLAHCRKVGFFEYRNRQHEPVIPFNKNTLATYRREIKSYYDSWDDRVFFKQNAENANGHTRAKDADRAASMAHGQASKALRDYITEHATVREVGLFASYTLACYRNDFDAHRAELTKRREAGVKGLPSCDDLFVQVDCELPFNLEIIARANRRLSA
jgi:hypothetical protein